MEKDHLSANVRPAADKFSVICHTVVPSLLAHQLVQSCHYWEIAEWSRQSQLTSVSSSVKWPFGFFPDLKWSDSKIIHKSLVLALSDRCLSAFCGRSQQTETVGCEHRLHLLRGQEWGNTSLQGTLRCNLRTLCELTLHIKLWTWPVFLRTKRALKDLEQKYTVCNTWFDGNRCHSTVGKATACIPYRLWLVSQLFHFLSSFLPCGLGDQEMMPYVLGPMSLTWETWKKVLAPGPWLWPGPALAISLFFLPFLSFLSLSNKYSKI